MRVVAIIPTLDEGAAIAPLVRGLLAGPCTAAVVVDGGSRDDTRAAARAAGAQVLLERRPGYGRAILCGACHAQAHRADVLAMVDGNGSITPADVARVCAAVTARGADLAIGVRQRGATRLRLHQRAGNHLAALIIAHATGVRYRDIGSVRAIRAEAFTRLAVDARGYGFPLQLQARAARARLAIAQVPVTLQPRTSRSKVSGTIRGSAGAAAAFARVLWTECRPPRRAR